MALLLEPIEERDSASGLQRRIRMGVAMAVLMTAVMGILSWRIARSGDEDADWVAHTYDVTGNLPEFTSAYFDDVETGARGFALTDKTNSLAPTSVAAVDATGRT